MIMDTVIDSTLIPTGTKVEVYWNLHRNCFSVRALEGDRKGRVVAHVASLFLADARFAVQPAGRERVRREWRKNVHAFVRGRVCHSVPNIIRLAVSYNPYKNDGFVDGVRGEPVEAARFALCETRSDGRAALSII